MARNHRLSVCIGEPGAQFVPRWIFWTQKDDAYLTTRALGGLYKMSLHASGIWVGAFTQESAVVVKGNRRTHRWVRPAEFAPGFVRGPEICIPRLDSRHDQPFFADPYGKNPIWVPAPQIRHSVHLITLFNTDLSQGLEIPEASQVLGELPLSNGETFAVIALKAPLNREGRRNVRHLRDVETGEGFGFDGPIGPDMTAGAVLSFGSAADDWPRVTHVALGSHNMRRTDGPLRHRRRESASDSPA